MRGYQANANASPFSTADLPKHNVVQVFGEGIVSAQPDKALITLGVITESKNLNEAQQTNSTTMRKVINSLIQLGIPNENIKTVQYTIETLYDYQDGKQLLRGYRVTHMIQVTLSEIALTGRVVDVAVNNGANSVTNIQFSLAHPEIYYNQALALAIRNAQQKAYTISQTLGVRVNLQPTIIRETSQGTVPFTPSPVAFAKMEATPIEPGQLQVKASITAQFSMDSSSDDHAIS